MNPRALPLLAILVIAVGYLSLHRPLQAQKAELARQHANLTEQTRIDQQMTANLIHELEAQLAQLEPQRASIEAALPRDLNPSDALALVRENATRNTIRVDGTSIDDPRQDGDLQTITITLDLNGSYANLLAFTADLETHPWPLTIAALALETNESGADPRLDAHLTLQLHAYNPQPLDQLAMGEWN